MNFAPKEQLIEEIKDIYIQAAERYLEDGDSLKEHIMDYYKNRPQTDDELTHVLGKKNEQERGSYVQGAKDFVNNMPDFIEKMERFFELQDTRGRRKKLELNSRLATEEEYELGAYTDALESQVRDAVLAARKKRYLTFQSGFSEKDGRGQFMDVYNKNVFIPEATLRHLKEQSIEVRIEHYDDRTTITLHPTGDGPIRLTKWKKIWEDLIRALPPADPGTLPNMKTYGEHIDFRKKQDFLRKSTDDRGGSNVDQN